MKTDIYKLNGKKGTKKIDLNDGVFGVEVKPEILSQYVYAYLSNQRQSNAHTKIRSEVRGGGRKPWRQKGTGRARTGSIRNPIFRAGGVTFGPRNNRNWKKGMNKEFKQAAMRQALSSLMQEKNLNVIESIKVDTKKPLTNQVASLNKDFDAKKITVVANEYDKDAINAFSNLQKTNIVNVNELNPYDLVYGGKVLLEEGVVKVLEERLGAR